MYIAYLSLTPYYIIKSELELNKGFADIFIKPFNNSYIKYFAILEVKYIKRDEQPTKQKIQTLIKEAKDQLQKYENDILITEFTQQNITLKKIILIFYGWELVKMQVELNQ
jgi:hypothetical protein